MRESNTDISGSTSSDALRLALESQIKVRLGNTSRIVDLDRRPLVKSSSFAIEELDVVLNDGKQLELVWKDLSRSGMLEKAKQIKPRFIYDPCREILVYEKCLVHARLGTAGYYGSISDSAAGRYWLFLERVTGAELYEIGEFEYWEESARWLARLHNQFAEVAASDTTQSAHLLHYDGDMFRLWRNRAGAVLRNLEQRTNTATRVRKWLDSHYDETIEQLVALPSTLIHGEFYASNVLIQRNVPAARDEQQTSTMVLDRSPSQIRVCPIDWEMAAIGPGSLDVAALISGKWTTQEKDSLVTAYYQALEPGRRAASQESFSAAVRCCGLHHCMQWLGWCQDWMPPEQQAHDWLSEAEKLINELSA